jgi:WD40 repeat protein/DNA-binding SARP family transcriptional activator
LLLLHRNEPIASDRLIDALWGETPPPTAAKVLQNYVGQLRRALDDRGGRRLQTLGRAYALRVEDGEVDADRFERLVREGGEALEHQRPADAAARLREALALWRGPPLADVAYESFAQAEIARLEERRAVALEWRIDADLALGRHADLVAELEALVARHPLRERLRAQRMLALYRCGRQAEALEAFRQARRLLVEEVGVEPGAELRGLHEAMLRQDRSLEFEPAELPRERWERTREGAGAVITVTGESGMGKTRLAAELAGELHRAGSPVLYAAGTNSSETVTATIGRAREARRPTLLVVDDAAASEDALAALVELATELSTMPVLALATAESPEGLARLGAEASLALEPLDADAVRRIALLYVTGDAAGDVPAEELREESRGVPARVHDAARGWARSEARSRVVAFAPRAAAGRSELRMAEAGLAAGVIDLQAAGGRVDSLAEHATPVVCPFKGLASFDSADAKYFCGRERLIAELVARSVGAPLLGVVGPSGSGKSSVVKAGLLPALAGGVLPTSDEWPQVVIRPGEHPMRELRGAVGGRAVLVVDQFEEVFTACGDEDERAAFSDALVRGAHERDGEGLVVLAIRADLYGRCATYPALSKLLAGNHVLVGPMQRDELRRAIELPAQEAGLHVEPELVDALLADVEREPGGLPLLSTALLELWQRRDGRQLRRATYELTGGVRGAVGRLAEDAFGRLEPAQQGVARTVLLRLAGEGTGGSIVPRRVALTELEGAGDEDLAPVLGALTERRLLTMSATTVEVAHEALLREWPRLRGWLEEDAEGRRVQHHLATAARDWAERGRDHADLYRGARLALALEWRAAHEPELNHTERAFLDASRAAAGRAQRRLRVVLAAVAALLAVAVAGTVVALHQRGTARAQARAAQAQRLGVQALSEPDLARSLLLARQAMALDNTVATRRNLLAALVRSPAAIGIMPGTGNPLDALDLSPDGRTLAVADAQGTVAFIDTLSRRRVGPVHKGIGAAYTVRFSPDGRRLLVRSAGAIDLLDTRTHRDVESFAAAGPGGAAHRDAAAVGKWYENADFSQDPHVLVAELPTDQDRRYILRLDARTGRVVSSRPTTTKASGGPLVYGFFAGGRRLVTSSIVDRRTVIRDAVTFRSVRVFRAGGTPAAVSPDGKTVALGAPDGSMRLLDLRTGAVREVAERHNGAVNAMRFSPNSRALATAGADGRVIVWNVERATPIEIFAGHAGPVQQVAFAPNGQRIYSAGQDGSVIAWDLAGRERLGRLFSTGSRMGTGVVAVTAAGASLAAPTVDGDVDLLDSRTLTPTGRIRLAQMPAPTDGPPVAAITDDGMTLAASTGGGAVGFADVRTRRPLGPPEDTHAGGTLALAFSGDGRRLASIGADGSLSIWDAHRRTPVNAFAGFSGQPMGVSVSPDGTKLVTSVAHDDGSGELNVLSVPRLAVLKRVRAGSRVRSWPAAPAGAQLKFSRDGRLLVYGDDAGQLRLYDTRTWRMRGSPLTAEPGPIVAIDLSPNDRTLAATSSDGKTRLWDIPSGRPIGALPAVDDRPAGMAFIENGTHLATMSSDGRGAIWDVRPQMWARRACEVAGRTLNRTEWQDALPERDYAPGCAHR